MKEVSFLCKILEQFLGTTGKGIGPTYGAKATRTGISVGELLNWETFVERYHNLYRNFN